MIGLNDYLDFFSGAKLTDKVGMKKLNEILLNNMPSNWINQAYVQGLD